MSLRVRGFHPVFVAIAMFITLDSHTASRASESSVAIAEAVQKQGLTIRTSGNAREKLKFSISNTGKEEVRIVIPSGLILQGSYGDRVATLREGIVDVPPEGFIEVDLPSAALSSKNVLREQEFKVTPETEARLNPLLNALASLDNIPRSTSQLAVLALLEDVTFSKWQDFTGGSSSARSAVESGDDVAQAIDALGLLKAVAPNQVFALGTDSQLKLRALRNPQTRTKAAQIYGLTVPGDTSPASPQVPRLEQLLHTRAGDNCPVCKLRGKAASGASDF